MGVACLSTGILVPCSKNLLPKYTSYSVLFHIFIEGDGAYAPLNIVASGEWPEQCRRHFTHAYACRFRYCGCGREIKESGKSMIMENANLLNFL